jgi:hypothetical protein
VARHAQLFDTQSGLLAASGGLFPPEIFTLDAFIAAAVAVRSRSHAPLEGPALALVPLADSVRGWAYVRVGLSGLRAGVLGWQEGGKCRVVQVLTGVGGRDILLSHV